MQKASWYISKEELHSSVAIKLKATHAAQSAKYDYFWQDRVCTEVKIVFVYTIP